MKFKTGDFVISKADKIFYVYSTAKGKHQYEKVCDKTIFDKLGRLPKKEDWDIKHPGTWMEEVETDRLLVIKKSAKFV